MVTMKILISIGHSAIRGWRYTVKKITAYWVRRFLNCCGYAEYVYRRKFGHAPDYINPRTFNEKIGWIMRYDHNPLYTKLADKITVRDYVRERVGENVLVPCYGVWNKASDIRFETLPDRFVLKCNHESGFVVLCRNKTELDQCYVRYQLAARLRMNYYYQWREWHYRDIPPRIMAEKLLMDDDGREPVDYKFHCFNGVLRFIYTVKDRHSSPVKRFYSPAWELLPFDSGDSRQEFIPRPQKLQYMLDTAAQLSRGLYYCRVDLYAVENHVYFNEMTLTPAAGMLIFLPDSYDLYWGERIILPAKKNVSHRSV
jgi:hypothetical protein